jgi:hypothetical protein
VTREARQWVHDSGKDISGKWTTGWDHAGEMEGPESNADHMHRNEFVNSKEGRALYGDEE